MKILIDNGHGKETPGKRSVDGRLREYAYTREIAKRVVASLNNFCPAFDAELLVPEEEDIPLKERVARVNHYCDKLGKKNVLLVSIHCNAAGNGSQWMAARGWSAYVSKNASRFSECLAVSLYNGARHNGIKVREYSKDHPWWVQNLAICRDTKCASVLTENMFMDNEEDLEYLLSAKGMDEIVKAHAYGIQKYYIYNIIDRQLR